MTFQLKVKCVLFCVVTLCCFQSQAQSVRGKVIYVSPGQEVKLKFRSAVENYSFVNRNQSGLFKVKLANSRNFLINSVVANFKATNLVVTEGENTHLFILAYKDRLDAASETLYDFSTKEKLQNETQKMIARKDAPFKNTQTSVPTTPPTIVTDTEVISETKTTEPPPPPPPVKSHESAATSEPGNKEVVKPVSNPPVKTKPAPVITVTYSSEINKANVAFKAGDYASAKVYFLSAQKLNPSAKYPALRIAEIDRMPKQAKRTVSIEPTGEREIAVAPDQQRRLETTQHNTAIAAPEKEIETNTVSLDSIRYEHFIHLADSTAWIAKDYKKALKWYDSALAVKPQTSYPKKQIRAVTQLQTEKEILTAKQNRKAAFNAAMQYYRKADTLRVERNYEDSYKNYKEFLSRVDTANTEGYMSSELHYIKEAKEYMSRLENYLPKPKVEAAPPPVTPEKQKRKKKKRS